MEADRVFKFKHICKFCNKSFPCGRSLGGHMRSHLTNSQSETSDQKLSRSKIQAFNNGGTKSNMMTILEAGSGCHVGYGLREKPKRKWSGDTLQQQDKFCRECGKAFQSWKALFGHMKCHSEKEKESSTIEEQESWTTANINQKSVMDSQSDNETATPNRKKRSKRQTRYMGTPNSSSFSFANNASSSANSEIDQEEQEEVAMCLMMLSRDVGRWGGFNSVTESSDNNSIFSELPSLVRTSLSNGKKIVKLKKHHGKKLETDESDQVQLTSKRHNSSKSKFHETSDPEPGWTPGKKPMVDSELSENAHKSSKFKCTACNKRFHSYQALGGHRASHRKIKGCFASIVESSTENSIETDNDNHIAHQMAAAADADAYAKKSKGHECPICFKVFSSGQALGGHKRSHLVGSSDGRKNDQKTIVVENSLPEIRDFLDLNLPAPVDEESNANTDHVGSLQPWWVENIQRREGLLGLISN